MIIQFGTSRFLQAHVDLFAHEAAEAGQCVPEVVVVQTTRDRTRAARLHAFNDPGGFSVITRGLAGGRVIECSYQVRSVTLGINAHHDWARLSDLFVNKASHVVSNTGDTGFVISNDDRDVAILEGKIPSCFPAILLALLHQRWAQGKEPVTLLPCELVAGNGKKLHDLILELAADIGTEEGFQSWLSSQCLWANTLVDRIVSEPLQPAGAIAEPYALWAIEHQAGLHLPFSHRQVHLVADLEPFERLKVHILNLGHSWLADRWYQDGCKPGVTVKSMLANEATKSALMRLFQQEVQPGFAHRGFGVQATEYIAQTIERFENPFLAHAVADIYQNHATKIQKRAGSFIEWVRSAGDYPPDLRELELLIARAN